MKILITGGIYPNDWQKIQEKYAENYMRFCKAEILEIDWDSGEVVNKINYVSPEESKNPSMMFKGGQVWNDKLNVVTNSEIVIYDTNTWKVENVITNKTFNDLHGVLQEEDKYWVVNTGLEIIQLVDYHGNVIDQKNYATRETWDRFVESEDYRKVGSTKPHEIHINHIFRYKNELCVTRMLNKDACGLNGKSTIFDIGVGNPHDGVVENSKIYFTTTNGKIIVFENGAEGVLEKEVIDVNEILGKSNSKTGGWCRGILPLDDDRVIVGFTKIRGTKFNEFITWAKAKGQISTAPTRLLEIDIKNKQLVKEMEYPEKLGTAIFSILRKRV